jgi:phage shock protein PspC (stress-responsive transcriptional regulator)
LQRSRHDYIVAGVCGGLAEFFGISVFWFRLAFLIALIPAVYSAWCFTCCFG